MKFTFVAVALSALSVASAQSSGLGSSTASAGLASGTASSGVGAKPTSTGPPTNENGAAGLAAPFGVGAAAAIAAALF